MSTAYDEIQYFSVSYYQTHPDRLATVAKLLGLSAPEVETARVLELGCAAGNNLIPLAESLPQAKFVGVDFSANQIAEGKKTVADLGLTNIELRAANIMDIGPADGLFDYIIVHGIFSWVPHEVQEKILEICNKNLTPQGIAYVSYNVLPGWRMRGMIRDMMLFHITRFKTPKEKIHQARAFLEFVVKSVPQDNNPYGAFLKSEMELLSKHPDSYLFHEHLEENNAPCYFHEFVKRAAAHGLTYLGDTDLRTMATHDLHADARKLLTTAPNQIESEQYMDFLRNRMFRMTLLVHAGQKPMLEVNGKRIREFLLAGSFQIKEGGPPLESNEPDTYLMTGGTEATASEPFVKAAMKVLTETWPERISCDKLIELASQKLGQPVPTDPAMLDRLVNQIGSALLLFFTGLPMGAVELSLRPLGARRGFPEKPKVMACARRRAGIDGVITNLRHQTIEVGQLERQLLPLLDGTNTKEDILAGLCKLVKQKKLQVHENKVLVVEPKKVKALLEKQLEKTMAVLAQNSMIQSGED